MGAVNDKSETTHSAKRENAESILQNEEIGMSIHYTLQRWRRSQNLTYRFGVEKTSITEYEKVTLISLPIDKNLLLISTDPNSNYFEIIKKVYSILEEK